MTPTKGTPDDLAGRAEEDDLGQWLRPALNSLIRRRLLVTGIAVATALGTVAASMLLPNRYTSEATIFAVQQRVPERYVVPTTTTDPTQALEAMVQEVLSRPRLLAVIDELSLHAEQKGKLKPEQLINLVRRDLTVEPVERMLGRGEVNAFKISFVAGTPEMAHAVTQRLTTVFIEQNLKTRADQAATTTEFLREQLESTRKDLEAQEQRLRDFKMEHLGELPEQQQGNLGILSALHSQLDNLLARRSQAEQQRLYLESLLSEYGRRSKSAVASVRSANGEFVSPLQAAENDLLRLEAEMKGLLVAYTPRHPAVTLKEKELIQQRILVESLKSAPKTTTPEKPTTDDASHTEQDVVAGQVRSQLRANALEVEDLTRKEQKLRTDIETYEGRLNATPVREQQLTAMQRDYDLLKQHYGELLKKEQESQLATDLEKRQEGQQFRLADPPNLPTVPSSPKRVKISLIGLAGGIFLGCALALLLEFRKPTLHSEEDALSLKLPMIVEVPLLLTPAEERAQSRKRIFEWIAVSAMVSVVVCAELYVYLHG